MAIRFGSVCSGIEAASVASEPFGWEAAWFSEIEPFPCAVLKHHFPDVNNLGDMTLLPDRILSGEVEAPDVFVGGTPCQAFSVAGNRESLSDDRGNLSLTFCEIANAIDTVRANKSIRPSVIFWENVPGVLNTKDNAFGCFLAELVGEDTALVPSGGKWPNAGMVVGPRRSIAWRVLDAQYFGLAQRRKRVFVVASADKDFSPAEVLFERKGVSGNTSQGREAGEETAGSLAYCADVAPTALNAPPYSRTGNDRVECDALVVPYVKTSKPSSADTPEVWKQVETAPIISSWPQDRKDAGTDIVVNVPSSGSHWDHPSLPHPSLTQSHNVGGIGASNQEIFSQRGCGLVPANDRVTHTLTGEGFDASEDGTGRWTPICFHPTQDPISSENISHAIGTGSKGGSESSAVVCGPSFWDGSQTHATLTKANANGAQRMPDKGNFCGVICGNITPLSNTITTEMSHQISNQMRDNAEKWFSPTTSNTVRRITPVEAERLQGFPDGWTAIPWKGKEAEDCPDGPRYKAIGNSWAVNCVRWIFSRIYKEYSRIETGRTD